MHIAIDTGGTFTDCVYVADGRLHVLKLRSTPDDPAQAMLEAVERIAGSEPVQVRHGTTVGTNTLLERKGARVAFVTTAGFEDTMAIGRQARPKLYDLFFSKEEPLAPAELRFGAAERTASDGRLLCAISEGELDRLTDAVRAAAPDAIAVSLLFGFANPSNEEAVARSLASLGVPVSVSHRILPEFREYERGSTVLINAYVAPKMQRYLEGLDQALEARHSELQVMQSSGGIVPAALAAREPVRTILSGPAGGVVGATAIAQQAGISKILTFDMGGTSTDVALVEGPEGLRTTTGFQILGMPVAVPMLDIHTVGAGGGSLAGFDRGGALRVGPQSAGARPGPICYGAGEQPTVTDANLLLGRLDANGFLGGGMQLDEARTREFAGRARGPVPTIEAFAQGIIKLADARMEQALRKISLEQGHDPRDFTLVSFGGAGPLHACSLARALQIPRVLVPCFPGALSAYGILASDFVRDYSRTVMLQPEDEALNRHFLSLEETGCHEMAELSLHPTVLRTLDIRYAGQGYELSVPWSADFVSAFHLLHEKRYGYADTGRPVEVVNVRSRLIASTQPLPFERQEAHEGDGRQAVIKEQSIFFEDAWHPGKLYDRARLQAGDRFAGPAVVIEYSATTFLPPGARASVDEFGNLVIQV
jgi:N-methylhydantoinase A